MRKLNSLWKIVQKQNDDPVKQIYIELKRSCFEKNCLNEVMGLRSRYCLPISDEEVDRTGKTEWCKKVKRTIYRFALNELNTASKVSSKSNMLPFYSNLKFQQYITGLHPKRSRLLFKAKLGMFNMKCNFKNIYRNNLLCPICSVTDKNLLHLTVCSSNPHIKMYKIKSSYDIYDNDLLNLKKWAEFLKKYEYLRNYMLGDNKETNK